jgi:polyhydroxybutyrate depolymerase
MQAPRVAPLLAALGLIWGAAPPQGGIDGALVFGGRRRTYHIHVPPSYDGTRAVPLVVALHGRGGRGAGMMALTHFDRVADHEGFIVVFPDGYRRSWADGRGSTPADRAGLDDVAFIARLIDTLSVTYRIDPGRVFGPGGKASAPRHARSRCWRSRGRMIRWFRTGVARCAVRPTV